MKFILFSGENGELVNINNRGNNLRLQENHQKTLNHMSVCPLLNSRLKNYQLNNNFPVKYRQRYFCRKSIFLFEIKLIDSQSFLFFIFQIIKKKDEIFILCKNS